MQFKLWVKDDGPIGGFTGVVLVNGQKYRVPLRVVWTQESRNTEPYAETCTYDSAEEVRAAARKFVARRFAHV